MTDHVTVDYREHNLTDDQLADLLIPIVAFCNGKRQTFTAQRNQEYVGGRGYVTTARLGSASTILQKRADGSYVAECPQAVYEMQAASMSHEEAERLQATVVDREAALPF